MKIVNCKIVNSRGGFTLIELLIAIAILVIVSSAGFIGLSGYKGARDVEFTMNELVSAIRDVQRRSVTEQSGKQWGLRFVNASSSYEIWNGSSYASGTVDKLYSLSRNITFGNPSTSTVDIIFSAISGKLSENRIVSLVNKRRDGIVGDVTLLSRGTITTRLDKGLVGYWHFDEATSTKAYDASGLANTGTLTNGPIWATAPNCKAGNCLSFDGTDDYVSVAHNSVFNLPKEITLSAWIKLDSVTSEVAREIIIKGDSSVHPIPFDLRVRTDGSVEFDQSQGGSFQTQIIGTTVLSAGQWYHIVATNDNSNAKVYINGVLEGTDSSPATDVTTDGEAIGIGARGENVANYFDGHIDEVRIYNRALSATEISNLYNDLK
ncbi:MAG: prepilin-type N-terminal cleavage/methylation domain-containing protein [Candidatus Brennerbacteria bacterium]|nr:prepilin-type N-terminal cleavage/methylation domain-containing protein [Candidatus Brennerbacteria bacterium]